MATSHSYVESYTGYTITTSDSGPLSTTHQIDECFLTSTASCSYDLSNYEVSSVKIFLGFHSDGEGTDMLYYPTFIVGTGGLSGSWSQDSSGAYYQSGANMITASTMKNKITGSILVNGSPSLCSSIQDDSLSSSSTGWLGESNSSYFHLGGDTAAKWVFTIPSSSLTSAGKIASNWIGQKLYIGTVVSLYPNEDLDYQYNWSTFPRIILTLKKKTETYTVTYSNNGGWTVPNAQTANVGTNLVLSSTIPTKANDNYTNYTTTIVYNNGSSNGSKSTQSYTQYTFDHWYNGDLTWNPGDTYTRQTSITLYIYYYYGTRWTGFQLPTPTRTGYTFDYWGDSSGNKLETSTGTDGAAGSWYYPRSTHSIYAYWKANTYTISYNANGGSGAPSSQTKTYGVTLTLSDIKPTKSDSTATITTTLNYNGNGTSNGSKSTTKTTSYTFKNWNTNSNGTGTSYNAGASYTANAAATLYAQWTTNNPTYSSFTLPTPTWTGHTFNGWYTASSGGTKIGNGGDSYSPTSSGTIYAQWTTNTYTVSYNANGGSGAPSNQIKTHGITLTLSSTIPSRDGYNFVGWGTSSTSTSPSYQPGSSYTANSAITLYAIWEVANYITTIKYFSSSTATSLITPKVHYYDGSNWIPIVTIHYYNGSSWVEVGDKIPYTE